MSDDNKKYESSYQYQLHANIESESISKTIDKDLGNIWSSVKEIFKSAPELGKAVAALQSAKVPDHQAKEIARKLRADPSSMGDLKGGILRPDVRAAVKKEIEPLARRIERHGELQAAKLKYDDLWKQALAGAKLTGKDREALLESLEDSRQAADFFRDERRSLVSGVVEDFHAGMEEKPTPDRKPKLKL